MAESPAPQPAEPQLIGGIMDMPGIPLVSVIVPAYNCSRFIPETLASLLAQDYPNTEIIVVNDGSTDDTSTLLKTYGDQIRLIEQPNTGAPGARNRGMLAARGDFVCFCDSDDVWASTKICDQVTYLQDHPQVGMVFCDWYVWTADSTGAFTIPASFGVSTDRQAIDPSISGWIYHKLLLDCWCLTSSVMFRKETMIQVGAFDTDLWNGDDYDYWIRTSRITEIHKLRTKLVLYRILPQSVARTPTRIHYEFLVVTRAIARWGLTGPNGETNSRRLINKRLAQMHISFGYLHYHKGDPRIAATSFAHGIVYRPLWYLPWVYAILSTWKILTKIRPAST
jgi:cellulose synthase/poly-beta-1,6-N-acetylglucosamine synthase-like glycosyltransferase